jgi:hypothetical protein
LIDFLNNELSFESSAFLKRCCLLEWKDVYFIADYV